MSAVFDKPSLWQRVRPVFSGFDGPLLLALVLLGVAGMLTMYSAGFDAGTRFQDHGRNMLLALVVIFLTAQVTPQTLMKLAVPLYTVGIDLSRESVPDATTLLKFRRLLLAGDLAKAMFEEINAHLQHVWPQTTDPSCVLQY